MELYQEERLLFIKKLLPLFGNDFVLKDATALALYYGLDRYSEDIDLDSKTGNMNFLDKLKKYENEWKINIRKDTKTVFRAMIDYGAITHLGPYPLKIEVSSRNKNLLQNNILKYKEVNGVNVYDVSEIIRMKVTTFTNRDKIRDLYDLGFLIQNYANEFTKDQLLTVYENIGYKGLDNLATLLQDELQTHKLKNLDAETYVLNLYDQCEKLAIKPPEKKIEKKSPSKLLHDGSSIEKESTLSKLERAKQKAAMVNPSRKKTKKPDLER